MFGAAWASRLQGIERPSHPQMHLCPRFRPRYRRPSHRTRTWPPARTASSRTPPVTNGGAGKRVRTSAVCWGKSPISIGSTRVQPAMCTLDNERDLFDYVAPVADPSTERGFGTWHNRRLTFDELHGDPTFMNMGLDWKAEKVAAFLAPQLAVCLRISIFPAAFVTDSHASSPHPMVFPAPISKHKSRQFIRSPPVERNEPSKRLLLLATPMTSRPPRSPPAQPRHEMRPSEQPTLRCTVPAGPRYRPAWSAGTPRDP